MDDLASVSTMVRSVSDNVRRTTATVSSNVRQRLSVFDKEDLTGTPQPASVGRSTPPGAKESGQAPDRLPGHHGVIRYKAAR
jgi:hypothetical protein